MSRFDIKELFYVRDLEFLILYSFYNLPKFVPRYTSRWSKGSAPRPTPTPNFVVSLKVGSREFVGEGSTAQAAKHSAAAKALQILKVRVYQDMFILQH